MGNAIMKSQSSSTTNNSSSANSKPAARKSPPKENSMPNKPSTTPKSSSMIASKSSGLTNNASSVIACRKCQNEQQTGKKDNTRHDSRCPRKKTKAQDSTKTTCKTPQHSNDVGPTKRKYNSSSSDTTSSSQPRKKQATPSEPIYYNKNPVKRTPIFDDDIDQHLISSIQSVRPDLTGGSGLGLIGFDVSSSQGSAAAASRTAASCSKLKPSEMDSLCHDPIALISQYSRRSSSAGSFRESGVDDERKMPAAAAVARSNTHDVEDVIELDCGDPPAEKATPKRAAVAASRNTSDLIVLDDSDDEIDSSKKSHVSSDVEVIEID